jgi:hypothetical protein
MRMNRPRSPLLVGAFTSVGAAVALDLLADEHPTHTIGLGLVALVVAVLRLLLVGRLAGLLSVLAAVLVAQPALHVTSKLGRHGGEHPGGDGLMHVIAADGPVTATQIIVSAIIVVAVAASARFTRLLIALLDRPARLLTSHSPGALELATIEVHTSRLGSMLRWCGWILRAARRGPPPSAADPNSTSSVGIIR